MALTKVPSNLDSVTATTQSQGDGSTNVATTAYVDTGLANLIDSAPGNLNTLNELAASMNDNASFFSTVLPLSGGTLTGDFTVGASPPDFTVDRTNSRVGINVNPDCGFQAKVDKARFQDPSAGQWLEINPDSNPVQIIASDQTGGNYCAFKLKINNGGGYPVTAMDVKGHSGAHVGFGTDAHATAKMIISKSPDSATQTTPQTILQLSNPCVTTASDIKVGQGPQIVFEIPDDQSLNKSVGAAIAAQKQIDDDNDSTTRLTFFTTQNDETLDEAMTILGDGTVGIGISGPGAPLHVDHSSSTAYDGASEILESVIIRNKNGTDNSGVNNVASLGLQVADGATSQGFINYIRTGNNTGDFSFSQRTGSSSYAEAMRIMSNGNVGMGTNSGLSSGPTAVGNYKVLQLRGSSTSNGGLIRIETSDGTSGVARFYAGSGSTVLESTSNTPLTFGTNGTIRATIDTSGRVGIGTAAGSADTKLHVKDTGSIELRLEADSNNNGQEDCFIRFYTDGKTQEGIAGMDNNNSSTLFNSNTENAMVFGTVSNLPTLFATNNTERMIITAAGSVGIGGSSPARNLHLYGIQRNQVSTTVNYPMIEFLNGNGQVGGIRTSGTATAYDTSSDYRLKENVSYDWDATSRLKQLKPARFNFKTDADTTFDGFLAHEVSDIVPIAVNGEKDDVFTSQDEANGLGTESTPKMQSIDYSKLIPLMVKTIQELEARITELEG